MAVRKLRTIAMAGAATAALAFGMTAAQAAGFWTVHAGSAPNGTAITISGKTTGPNPQVHFTDVTTGTALTCTSAGAKGKTTVGPHQPGNGIASITGAQTTWTGCQGPLGIALTPHGIGAWKINALSYAAGVTTGTITAVNAHVTGTGCAFDVKGSVPISYKNSNTTLSVKATAANLTISGVSGCFGAVGNGDSASFKANYKLTATGGAAHNPVTITKP